jgi:molybdate transport system substrate-binding protein
MKQMKAYRRFSFLSLIFITFVAVVGCNTTTSVSSNPQETMSAESVTLTVSAAASLEDAIAAIEPIFEKANPTILVDYNFGSSGTLQQQIEQGAPADVFISAAAKQMNALEEKGLLVPESRRDLVANQLVLIVPADSTLNLTDFSQLKNAEVGKIAVGEFRSVPAGQYAEEVFNNLKLTASLQPKFVFTNNVRGVLAAVESGNADAGVVYETDAKLSDRVKIVAIAPKELHKAIVYPIAVLQSSPHPEAAQTYSQFLSEAEAQAVFQQYGFVSNQ